MEHFGAGAVQQPTQAVKHGSKTLTRGAFSARHASCTLHLHMQPSSIDICLPLIRRTSGHGALWCRGCSAAHSGCEAWIENSHSGGLFGQARITHTAPAHATFQYCYLITTEQENRGTWGTLVPSLFSSP